MSGRTAVALFLNNIRGADPRPQQPTAHVLSVQMAANLLESSVGG